MTTPLRVRFAPSPTGSLHVGGARTALYNYCLARRNGGTLVLRIEDTDRERSSQEMVQAILDGLGWLGIDWDEGPYFSSERHQRHVAVAAALLDQGQAFFCYCSGEDYDAGRRAAQQDGGTHRCECRQLEHDEILEREREGRTRCIRFKVRGGMLIVQDLVHGATRFELGRLEDFVLVRTDGSPTYHLNVVTDDLDMGISHVIRGDDHLSNTPKQVLMYEALGVDAPRFGHLPLILGSDRKKLSKRHGTTSVTSFRDQGYLPESLFNFLALLGWSPKDDSEFMTREEIVERFDLDAVNPVAAIFDLDKLGWLAGQHINAAPAAGLIELMRPGLEELGLWRDSLLGAEQAWFEQVVGLLRARARRIPDLVRSAVPWLTLEFEYDPEAVRKRLGGDGLVDHVRALHASFSGLEVFDVGTTEKALRELADTRGLKAGELIHPCRVGVSGQAVGPSIFDMLAVMGRERVLERLARLADWLESRPA